LKLWAVPNHKTWWYSPDKQNVKFTGKYLPLTSEFQPFKTDLLKKTFMYAGIIRRLGIHNVGYVAWYRFSIKTGIRKRFPSENYLVLLSYLAACPIKYSQGRTAGRH
jgi:hypothetical protein